MIAEAVTAVALAAHHAPARPRAGARVGVVQIPRLHLRMPFFQGVSARVLANGPGHYPETSLPGHAGTVGIAGHRVTHTHPFRRINLMRKHDWIVLRVGGRRFVYSVFQMSIVRPWQVWPIANRGRAQQLVLTACHPAFSASFRIVVFARRIR